MESLQHQKLHGATCLNFWGEWLGRSRGHGLTISSEQWPKMALKTIKNAEIGLNREKFEFKRDRIEYFGHVIAKHTTETEAFQNNTRTDFCPYSNSNASSRYNNVSGYIFTKFIKYTQLNSRQTWSSMDVGPTLNNWLFQKVKELLSEAPILAVYDPSKPTILSVEANS